MCLWEIRLASAVGNNNVSSIASPARLTPLFRQFTSNLLASVLPKLILLFVAKPPIVTNVAMLSSQLLIFQSKSERFPPYLKSFCVFIRFAVAVWVVVWALKTEQWHGDGLAQQG